MIFKRGMYFLNSNECFNEDDFKHQIFNETGVSDSDSYDYINYDRIYFHSENDLSDCLYNGDSISSLPASELSSVLDRMNVDFKELVLDVEDYSENLLELDVIEISIDNKVLIKCDQLNDSEFLTKAEFIVALKENYASGYDDYDFEKHILTFENENFKQYVQEYRGKYECLESNVFWLKVADGTRGIYDANFNHSYEWGLNKKVGETFLPYVVLNDYKAKQALKISEEQTKEICDKYKSIEVDKPKIKIKNKI